MRPTENIKKLIRDASIKTHPAVNKAVLNNLFDELDKSKKMDSAILQPSVWRIIMKSKITKFAIAAVILIAAAVSITFLTESATPAYAIEQTIEAMRSVHSIHAFITDWDNSKGEAWVQTNPETGQEEYYYADQGNLLIVGTPQATYYYYKDKNLVRIRNEYVPASEVRFSHFFEDLTNWIQKYHGELHFYSQFDEGLHRDIIVVHFAIPAQKEFGEKEYIVNVDSETKLPINFKAIKCGQGEGVMSVDSLEYNAPIPAGIFEFKIPAGAQVVY
jgi:outer membrane lipoprotein-sorting protein